jgi:polysaccharide biosynthesis transport protein
MNENTTIPTVGERLYRLGQMARRHWAVIVSVTVVATLAAVFVASRGRQEYTAVSKLVLDDSQLVGTTATTALVPNPDPQRDINTKVALIRSGPVATAVDDQLRLGLPLATLLGNVNAATEGTSNIVDITATDGSSAQAVAIANAFARQYVAYRRSVARSSLQAAAAEVRAQLAQPGGATQAGALKAELRALNLAAAGETGGALVVAQATRTTVAGGTSPAALGFVGAIVGLLLAAAIVALLELTDRKLKDGEEVSSVFGTRVLAEIPSARPTRQGSVLADGSQSQRVAFDVLAGQLLLVGRRRPLAVVMVTSPGPDDGKTAVAFGLARALARLDRSVLVVETDAERSILQGSSWPGLSEVINGTTSLDSAVVDLEVAGGDGAEQGSAPPAGGLISVLPAGSGDPPHRLRSGLEVASAIASCRELADCVLIDGPSTQRLHDALGLVDTVDGAVVVSRLRWTATDALHGALETLDVLAIRMLGLVLTNATGNASPPRGTRSGGPIPAGSPEAGIGGNGNGYGHPVENGAQRQAAPARSGIRLATRSVMIDDPARPGSEDDDRGQR